MAYDKEGGKFLNQKVEKIFAWDDYLSENPNDKRYMNSAKFKEQLLKYAKYAELEVNPTAKIPGGRLKSNGSEFFILADNDFNIKRCCSIRNKADLEKVIKPLNPDE